MEKIYIVWRKVLKTSFEHRFSKCISNEKITENVNTVIANFNTFTPECLYKNIVFCSSETIIPTIALDYAERFVDNFIETFKNPYSCEIDECDDKELLKNIIEKQMFVFNHQIETMLHCELPLLWKESYNNISKIYDIDYIHKHTPIWVQVYEDDFHKRYYFTISQIVYISVFGINPQTGNKFSDDTMKKFKLLYPERYDCMIIFKKYHSEGAKHLCLI